MVRFIADPIPVERWDDPRALDRGCVTAGDESRYPQGIQVETSVLQSYVESTCGARPWESRARAETRGDPP